MTKTEIKNRVYKFASDHKYIPINEETNNYFKFYKYISLNHEEPKDKKQKIFVLFYIDIGDGLDIKKALKYKVDDIYSGFVLMKFENYELKELDRMNFELDETFSEITGQNIKDWFWEE